MVILFTVLAYHVRQQILFYSVRLQYWTNNIFNSANQTGQQIF